MAVKSMRDVIENREVEKLLYGVNNKIEELFGEDVFDIFEILEEGIKSFEEKSFFITDARIGRDREKGYAIEYINKDDELVVDSAYRLTYSGDVSEAMLDKIREMAYMGYVLRQPRDREIKEVFKD